MDPKSKTGLYVGRPATEIHSLLVYIKTPVPTSQTAIEISITKAKSSSLTASQMKHVSTLSDKMQNLRNVTSDCIYRNHWDLNVFQYFFHIVIS